MSKLKTKQQYKHEMLLNFMANTKATPTKRKRNPLKLNIMRTMLSIFA
jgi:hypothetical protein